MRCQITRVSSSVNPYCKVRQKSKNREKHSPLFILQCEYKWNTKTVKEFGLCWQCIWRASSKEDLSPNWPTFTFMCWHVPDISSGISWPIHSDQNFRCAPYTRIYPHPKGWCRYEFVMKTLHLAPVQPICQDCAGKEAPEDTCLRTDGICRHPQRKGLTRLIRHVEKARLQASSLSE